VLLIYAVLIVATLAVTTVKLPDSGLTEARAANVAAEEQAR
jgi:hypothetical protein